jgi:peptide/nickel transport system permease protein
MRLAGIIANRFARNKLSLIGASAVLFLLLVALLAPFISPYSPTAIDVHNILSPPTKDHVFGTDEIGRDVFSRMIWGSRISLQVGFVAVGISIIVGIIIGALAGYYGGWVDAILMRFVDIMLTIPTLFLILAVIAVVEPSIYVIMVVIGITSWMGIARLVRAEFLSLKERDFVLSAKSLGASDRRIIFRHILPNALAPVFVTATFRIAGAILLESGLSFLGMGVQPPNPSWGNILTAGKENIEVAWWLSLYPGVAILIAALSYNLVGEGLRDALDPRLWEAGSGK